MDEAQAPIPLGSAGRLLAQPLTNVTGDHALLVRQGEAPRALLIAEAAQPGDDGRDRVVVVPLDADVELRMDGDALAVWLASGSVGPVAAALPGWASAIGLLLVVTVVGFAVLGSLTFFAWLVRLLA